jgi:hypothetical protein
MTDDRQPPVPAAPEEQGHVGPPDLILQAIVPPTDAPAEIRAAVASALARGVGAGELSLGWEDIHFAASAIALVEGTNRRAEPDTEWVFALRAEAPRLGEQIHSSGDWASAIQSHAYAAGGGRLLWRISVFDALRTQPRRGPEAPAE